MKHAKRMIRWIEFERLIACQEKKFNLFERSQSDLATALLAKQDAYGDMAFLWLEKAVEERAGQLVFLNLKADWDPLRSDPRFIDLVKRIGLK